MSCLALVLPLLGGCAVEEARENWAYDIATELMSPYCPGRTLAECPSPQAGELRAWIAVQAAAGRTRDDVVEELYGRFGDQIRAAPRPEGIGIAAYALPIGAFLFGGVLLAVVLRRMTGGGPPESPADGPPSASPPRSESDAELERIVDEELRG